MDCSFKRQECLAVERVLREPCSCEFLADHRIPPNDALCSSYRAITPPGHSFQVCLPRL